MANSKKFYIDFNGKKVEFILEKGLTLSQKTSFVMEVAGMVVSSEVGYAYVLKDAIFNYCLIIRILCYLRMNQCLVWI